MRRHDDGVDSDVTSTYNTTSTASVTERDEQAEVGIIKRRYTVPFLPLPARSICYLSFLLFGFGLFRARTEVEPFVPFHFKCCGRCDLEHHPRTDDVVCIHGQG